MSFATTVINQFDSAISDLSIQIAEFERLLDGLRQEKARLEAERQARQTAAAAGDSALEQITRFLAVANRIGDRQLIDEFWGAVDSLRHSQGARPELAAAAPAADEQLDTPTPPNPSEDTLETASEAGDSALEVAQEQQVAYAQEAATATSTAIVVEDNFDTLTVKELKAILKAHDLPTTGKRWELIERLRNN